MTELEQSPGERKGDGKLKRLAVRTLVFGALALGIELYLARKVNPNSNHKRIVIVEPGPPRGKNR